MTKEQQIKSYSLDLSCLVVSLKVWIGDGIAVKGAQLQIGDQRICRLDLLLAGLHSLVRQETACQRGRWRIQLCNCTTDRNTSP